MPDLTRREVLQLAATGAVASILGPATAGNSDEDSSVPPVENGLFTRLPIEIYTNTLSAVPGDIITLHVSTTAKQFDLQIARAGRTDKVVWAKNGLSGRFKPAPDDAWERGCNWPVTETLKIPPGWRSGFYQISAVTADKGVATTTAFAFVVVRAIQPTAKILLVLPTATYGAYNIYGGAGLYVKRNLNFEFKGGWIGGEPRVSFLRPWMPGFVWKPEAVRYHVIQRNLTESDKENIRFDDHFILLNSGLSGISANSYAAGFDNWDRVMVQWLEKNRYAVDYAVSSDLELHPELLSRYRLMLSVGHDEYWSWDMRDTVESFIRAGGNVCFFSADMAWQIRHENNGNTMVCYKDSVEDDPLFETAKTHLTTTLWGSPIVGRPETSLLGVSYVYGGYARAPGASPQGPGGYLVSRPEHWIFKDSGLCYGDCLGQTSKILNFEVDGCPIRIENGLPYPTRDYDGPSSFEILGFCPVAYPEWNPEDSIDRAQLAAIKKLLGGNNFGKALVNNRGFAVMGLYTNNGTVFTCGTTDWTNALTGEDPAVEQITKNLLDRLSV